MKKDLKIFKQFLSQKVILVMVCLIAISTENAAQLAEDGKFVLGFSSSTFDKVNSKDIEAATKLLIQEIIRSTNHNWISETKVYDDIESIDTDIIENKLTLVAITTYEYSLLKNKVKIRPILIPKYDGYIKERLVILSKVNSNVNSIKDLKNKKVLMQKQKRGILSNLWVHILLNNLAVKNYDQYFKEILIEEKASKSIMELFFNKADAVVTTNGLFSIMSELNPQVKREIKIIEKSEPIVFAVLCLVENSLFPEDQESVIEKLKKLDEQPSGNQILKIFKINKLIPFEEEYLIETNEIIKKYNAINDQSMLNE